MNEHRCQDCGKTHDTWTASTLCCEPKRSNIRAISDSHCKECGRFVPAGFGCHGKYEATNTEYQKGYKARKGKTAAVVAELREMRGTWTRGMRV